MSEEIGKAYLAFTAYNHKAKKGRLQEFDLKRWLKVVKALAGSRVTKPKNPDYPRPGWTLERRKKFIATMTKKRMARLANGKASHP